VDWNTNLIKLNTLVGFIGELLLDLELAYDHELIEDHSAVDTLIDAVTDASPNHVVDSNKWHFLRYDRTARRGTAGGDCENILRVVYGSTLSGVCPETALSNNNEERFLRGGKCQRVAG